MSQAVLVLVAIAETPLVTVQIPDVSQVLEPDSQQSPVVQPLLKLVQRVSAWADLTTKPVPHALDVEHVE
jgi:hypothetical protein